MKKLIGVFAFLAIALSGYAQNYNTAAGIRISDGIGTNRSTTNFADKLTSRRCCFYKCYQYPTLCCGTRRVSRETY